MDLSSKTINEIGFLIERSWINPFYGAIPYMKAMQRIVNGAFYQDDEETIILYFLSNARTWKGETAREVKKELKRRVNIK